jgi:hypothetical protein
MFGLHQAFAKNVKFCSDGPSGLQNRQFCSDRPIWPPKSSFFTHFTTILRLHYEISLSTYPIRTSRPTSTFLASCDNSFDCLQYILKSSPQFIEDIKSVRPSWLSVSMGVATSWVRRNRSDGSRAYVLVPMQHFVDVLYSSEIEQIIE